MSGPDEILTLDEVATEIRMSKDYVRKQCESGALVAKKLGNRWRIIRRDLDAFMVDGIPSKRTRDTRLSARQQKAAS